MEVKKELWGKSACGKEIYLYTLTNTKGAYVQLGSIGAAIVYLMGMINGGNILYEYLRFDKAAIFRGQVWRLFTYVFTYTPGGGVLTLLFLYFFYNRFFYHFPDVGNLLFYFFCCSSSWVLFYGFCY